MHNLWKKESNRTYALFVDLFAEKKESFIEWDKAIRANNWKHEFSDESIEAVKNNTVSDKFCIEGTEKTLELEWREAMELYSQSLRFAEAGTDKISYAYVKRSECFLNMGEYEKCLTDIELAFKANCSMKLIPILEKRKKECEKRLQQRSEKFAPFVPKLDYTADEKFPCIADILNIEYNEEFGRHIVAKCDIPVGKTIVVEKSFVSTIFNHDRARCSTCLKTGMNFIACSNCTDTLFCSEDCQTKNKVHQKFCGTSINRMPKKVNCIAKSVLIGLDSFSSANEMMKFIKDILSKRENQMPETINDPRSKYAFFLSLKPGHENRWDIDTVYQVYTALMTIPYVKNMFGSKQSKRFLMHLVGEHMLINKNNSFYSPSFEQTFCVVSLFNHSCTPNVDFLTNYNGDYCKTVQPVKQGQQLFISYLGGDEDVKTTSQRQHQLMKSWNFLCKCSKCTSNEGSASDESFSDIV